MCHDDDKATDDTATENLKVFSLSQTSWKLRHTFTGRFEFPEVDVDQDEMDDGRAVPLALFWFKDVAFLQTLAVEDLRVNFGEWEFVHASPFFCQQELLK